MGEYEYVCHRGLCPEEAVASANVKKILSDSHPAATSQTLFDTTAPVNSNLGRQAGHAAKLRNASPSGRSSLSSPDRE